MGLDLRPALVAALSVALLPANRLAAARSSDPDQPFIDAYRGAEPVTTWPLKRILHEGPGLKGLKPAPDQSALPVALAKVAARLESFWHNFQNTTSIETIEESRELTNSPAAENERAVQRFRYLMLTDPANPLQIKEYRTDLQGRARNSQPAASGFVRTSGFTSLPLVFGPNEQLITDYRDLGSQVLRERQCRVLAFAQHIDPAGMSHWNIAGQEIPILVQGVAWIDAAGGQVVQMRTDLLAPQPRAGLHRATTVVTFAPVQFHRLPATFWLPHEVSVSIDLDRYTYTNRHYYTDYRLFAVLTSKLDLPILSDGLGIDVPGPAPAWNESTGTGTWLADGPGLVTVGFRRKELLSGIPG